MEQWMKKGLSEGTLVDVSRFHRTADDGYIIENYRDGLNYLNVLSGEQITIILRRKKTGEAVAFTSFRGLRDDYEREPLWVH